MKYEIRDGNIVITGYVSHGLSVEIPAEIEGHAVTELAPYAFSGTNIEEIFLPESVVKIGRYAFYNCKNLKKIGFYNTMKDLGAGAFTGCHNIREIALTFVRDKKSCLREFLIELSEEQNVTFYMDDGEVRLFFPEYFEEAIENTPARILETRTHGSGMLYRNCFVQKELDIRLYDENFDRAKGLEFPETMLQLAVERLLYPYQLGERAKEKYTLFLKEHLAECAKWAGALQKKEVYFYLAKHVLETADELEILIQEANKRSMTEVLSFLMQEKHQRFGTRRKTFEL